MTDSGEILAVRLPNWVGDLCMALPALARLRAAGFRLHAFGRGWAADLLAGEPDRVEKLPAGLRSAVRAIAASRTRRGVIFPNSFSSALQMRLAGVHAAGCPGGFRRFLLGECVPRQPGLHEVETFWRVAGAYAPPAEVPPGLGLRLAERHHAQAAEALARAGIDRPYAILAPLAVGTIDGRPKQWPGFPLLARMLADHFTIVACPGPGEEAATAQALPGAVLLNGLGLGAYGSLMRGARVVVANDSGPMHIAAAVGVPVVGVFGVSDPGRTRPWSPRARTLGGAMGWPPVDAVAAAVLAEAG